MVFQQWISTFPVRSVRYVFIIDETNMQRIAEIAEGCVREAADDYVGLWQIATRVRREFEPSTNLQVKRLSLDVVRLIVRRGLCPGDYGKTGFSFWDLDNLGRIIARIDGEWNPMHGDPTLVNPICWF